MFLEAIKLRLLCLQAERLGKWEQHFCTQASFLPYLISTKHLIIQRCFTPNYYCNQQTLSTKEELDMMPTNKYTLFMTDVQFLVVSENKQCLIQFLCGYLSNTCQNFVPKHPAKSLLLGAVMEKNYPYHIRGHIKTKSSL